MNKTTLNSQEEKHSMLSLRRTTSVPVATRAPITVNFYPRSPCGERHGRRITRKITLTFLSTLSLRRATLNLPSRPIDKNISIHALLAESDNTSSLGISLTRIFLSTLSLRRATSIRHISQTRSKNFYPRSPCGERRCLRCCAISCITISIHALLAESDKISENQHKRTSDFYPRSPCGERRQQPAGEKQRTYFYPRSPCGERQTSSR